MNETVESFSQSKILVLDQSTAANVAARAMYERKVGSIVVSDRQGHIVGLVTDRDLTCQLLAFDLPADTPISEIMATDVLSVQEGSPLSEAIDVMESNGIRRVPVIQSNDSGKDRCIGLVTLDDLIVGQKVDIRQVSNIIRSQIVRRVRVPVRNERSEERKEQTLSRFYKIMSKNMALDKELAGTVAFHILRLVVQRLPYTEAAHLITQLPNLIQEDLFNLPAGPKKTISLDSILDSLAKEYGFSWEGAKEALNGFWLALKESGDSRELDHVIDQLPSDLQSFFKVAQRTPVLSPHARQNHDSPLM